MPGSVGRPRLRDLGRLLAAASTAGHVAGATRRRRRAGEPLLPTLCDEVRNGFEHLGPTYVKLGQMIASTPALFPDMLVQAFQGCLDEVRPLPIESVRAVITSELGDDPHALFAEFDTTPLASASIGQAHRAVRHDGEEVVVKVQRPDIADRISTDLRIMHFAATLAERSSKRARLMQPRAVVEDFATTLSSELSYVVEARSMEAVAAGLADFADHHLIHIPSVDWRHTTPRVLTMEYVHGTRLDDVEALRNAGIDPAALLKVAVTGWLHGTLVHGVFHGDLHAGNLLVDRQGRVTFLDFGICGRLTPDARDALFAALPALMSRDMRTVAATIFVAGGADEPLDLDAITADMEGAILPILDRPLAEVSYATAFIEVVRIGIRHGVLLPRDLILVFKQFFYVERFTRLLAPEWTPLNDPDILQTVLTARQRLAA